MDEKLFFILSYLLISSKVKNNNINDEIDNNDGINNNSHD